MGFSRQEYWSGVPLPSPHPPYTSPSLIKSERKRLLLHFLFSPAYLSSDPGKYLPTHTHTHLNLNLWPEMYWIIHEFYRHKWGGVVESATSFEGKNESITLFKEIKEYVGSQIHVTPFLHKHLLWTVFNFYLVCWQLLHSFLQMISYFPFLLPVLNHNL